MTDITKSIATIAGAVAVFCLSWMFIGFAARAVVNLFCLGYGC